MHGHYILNKQNEKKKSFYFSWNHGKKIEKQYLLNIFASNSSNQHFTAISRVLPNKFYILESYQKKILVKYSMCVGWEDCTTK